MRTLSLLLALCIAGLPILRPAAAWSQNVRLRTRTGSATGRAPLPYQRPGGTGLSPLSVQVTLTPRIAGVTIPSVERTAVEKTGLPITLGLPPAAIPAGIIDAAKSPKKEEPASLTLLAPKLSHVPGLSSTFDHPIKDAETSGSVEQGKAEKGSVSSWLSWIFDRSAAQDTLPVVTQTSGQGRSISEDGRSRSILGAFTADRPGEKEVDRALSRLDGSLSAADFKPETAVKDKRRALLFSHFLLLAAGAAAIGAGAGLAAAGLAAGVLGIQIAWSALTRDRYEPAGGFNSSLFGAAARDYKQYQTRLLNALTDRLGLRPEDRPSMRIYNSKGDFGAVGEGPRLDSSAVVWMGEGYRKKPVTQTMAVIAHELGHLVFGDNNILSLLRLRPGFRAGRKIAVRLAVYSTLFAALGHSLGAAVLLTWGGGAIAAAAAALLAGAAAGIPFSRIKAGLAASRSAALIAGLFRWSGIGAVLTYASILAGLGFWTGAIAPAAFLLSAGLVFSGIGLAIAGLLAGIAVSRQEELLADDFAAWLTDAQWVGDHFSERVAAKRGSAPPARTWFQTLVRRLMTTHPTDAERALRMKTRR